MNDITGNIFSYFFKEHSSDRFVKVMRTPFHSSDYTGKFARFQRYIISHFKCFVFVYFNTVEVYFVKSVYGPLLDCS